MCSQYALSFVKLDLIICKCRSFRTQRRVSIEFLASGGTSDHPTSVARFLREDDHPAFGNWVVEVCPKDVSSQCCTNFTDLSIATPLSATYPNS